MTMCRGCRTVAVEELLDFGPQPVCSRYLRPEDAEDYTHPLAVGWCHRCGLMQIVVPFPDAELLPRYGWIRYNEPERHLDAVADVIAALPGMTADTIIRGMSYKDDTLLMRLADRGFAGARRVDAQRTHAMAALKAVAARDETDAEVLIARHVLEHAGDVQAFVAGLREAVPPGGYVVVETPECTDALERPDYTTLWEEHTVYFTPDTLPGALAGGGLQVLRQDVYRYARENSLVAIAQPAHEPALPRRPDGWWATEWQRAQTFAKAFAPTRAHVRDRLAAAASAGQIVVLGAGHLTCSFINYFGLADLIQAVLDDDPNKQGLLMPGSRLPIIASDALHDPAVRLCLLGTNSESDEKIIGSRSAFTQRGGRFASIFPESAYALWGQGR